VESGQRNSGMKSVFYVFETKTEKWVDEAKAQYQKKIAAYFPFSVEGIKSPQLSRDDAAAKKKAEAQKFLKLLKPQDYLVLFDESGETFRDSEACARNLHQILDRSPSRLIFLIGGAFGVDDSVAARAQACWSLSPLTMNHWVAQIMALEQIYRSMTIIKKIPYHNR
jgi:23S rRNA (pseudouridine1915-N3)-methyltransferase